MLYESLDVWKRSRQLSIDVYRQLAKCRDYGFKDQITRSALSVPSNIAEGFERSSIKERIRFIDIAKASMGEFKTQADIGREVGFIERSVASEWIDEAAQLSKMLAGLTLTLKAKDNTSH